MSDNIYLKLVTMLVRIFFVWLSGAMVSHLSPKVYTVVNDTITQFGGMEVLIGSVASTIGVTGLAIWLRLKTRLRLVTAMELPASATMSDVKEAADNKSVIQVLKNPNEP